MGAAAICQSKPRVASHAKTSATTSSRATTPAPRPDTKLAASPPDLAATLSSAVEELELADRLREQFRRWDLNGDGVIDRAELETVLDVFGIPALDIDKIWRNADLDENSCISYDDFVDNIFPVLPKQIVVGGEEAASTIPLKEALGEHAVPSVPIVAAEGVQKGSLGLLLLGTSNVPHGCQPYVLVEVFASNGKRLAFERSYAGEGENPRWNQVMSLPSESSVSPTASKCVPLVSWDVSSSVVKFTLYDNKKFWGRKVGECRMPLLELCQPTEKRLLLWDKNSEAVLGSSPPHMPCELAASIVPGTVPPPWPVMSCTEREPSYPRHVFMMTRGTRGDVQPFVALARGMAEQFGWKVTICTEVRWKSLVDENADVSRGRIDFRPSGGDTEARMGTRMARWALESKSAALQMVILANSEVEFFGSATAFVYHVLEIEHEDQPVDLLVFGLTVARVAALISNLCEKPLIGFILQPSCIPSDDIEWTAVQHIKRPGRLSRIEESLFTSHSALRRMRAKAETTSWAKFNLEHLRRSFGLPVLDTWQTMKELNVPLLIPMREDTFVRPSDWWPRIRMTEFIFLRRGAPGSRVLPPPFSDFVASARRAGAKLALMSFSSMPVARSKMLACAVKMVTECQFNLRLIYVGRRQREDAPKKIEEQAAALVDAGRFLEAERADFGVLFSEMDCFIVHGGLGTTVEALRLKRPCCVTGPLLLDQRFWGTVCFQKGVGPEPVHIDDFDKNCVNFVNGALDPADPCGWQANARSHDWGSDADDGVAANAKLMAIMLDEGIAPVRSLTAKHCLSRKSSWWRPRSAATVAPS